MKKAIHPINERGKGNLGCKTSYEMALTLNTTLFHPTGTLCL